MKAVSLHNNLPQIYLPLVGSNATIICSYLSQVGASVQVNAYEKYFARINLHDT